jgi:hypothetical protein
MAPGAVLDGLAALQLRRLRHPRDRTTRLGRTVQRMGRMARVIPTIVLAACAADYAFNGAISPLTVGVILIVIVAYRLTEEP